MATGSPVSFWYGTRAQFDSITTKLDTVLYFITDEQALYKGTVKFSGSGVDTLLTISATEPTASSVTTGDKYFNTSDNLIHVLKNENGTVTTTATYEPANGALYYNADAQRFQTLIKNGSSYTPTEIYDAGISVEDGTGLILNGTTVSGIDATTNSKGVVQVGSNLNVSDGVISVPTATNAVFGVVKSGDNITNTNGVLSVGKATTSALGVVKVGDNINVDNNGKISVPVADGSTKGVVQLASSIGSSETNVVTEALVREELDDLQDEINAKQDELSPGAGIALDGSVISATGAVSMTTTERMALTPAPGFLIWDTYLEKLFVGDGSTIGGKEIEGGGGGGGGGGTVTGIKASVSGNTATIIATGSTTSVDIVGTDGVGVKGNTNTGAVELDAKDLSDGTQSITKDLVNARWIPSDAYEATPQNALTLLHFSDIHADTHALARIVAEATALAPNINGMICTGDIVEKYSGDGYRDNVIVQQYVGVGSIADWWNPNVMTVIGNHDTATTNNPYNYTAVSMADRDAYYIAPFESNWGITHTSGTSYYYKDYTTQKVRLIVLDIMLYGNDTTNANAVAQTNWLQGLLASAITAGLHVLIACHAAHTGSLHRRCSFSNFKQADLYTFGKANTPDVVINAVAAAITNGLHFCGYIVGHHHRDNVWDATGDGTQLIYCITTANVTEEHQYTLDVEQYRSPDYDAFNLLSIDTKHTTLKLLRAGGANIDCRMRPRQFISVNYSTGVITDYEIARGVTPEAAGFGMEVDIDRIARKRYDAVQIPNGSTVTLQAGYGYQFTATSAVTLETEVQPSDSFGIPSLLDITLSGGTVVAGENVVIADSIQDGRNICSVQYIDGYAVVKVLTVINQIPVGAYVVTMATGTADGSLYYGLVTSEDEDIYVSLSLHGQTVDFGGSTVSNTKQIIGQGPAVTVLGGTVNPGANLVSMHNLGLSNTYVSGGTLFIGSGVTVVEGATVDGAYLAPGSDGAGNPYTPIVLDGGTVDGTVVISGGSHSAIRGGVVNGKIIYTYPLYSFPDDTVYLSGTGIIDGNHTGYLATNWGDIHITGLTICDMYNNVGTGNGAGFQLASTADPSSLYLTDVLITGCFATGSSSGLGFGGGVCVAGSTNSTTASLTNCVITGCTAKRGGGLGMSGPNSDRTKITCTVTGCTFSNNVATDNVPYIDSAHKGGSALFILYATANLIDCLFVDNEPTDNHAIICYGGDINITGGTFGIGQHMWNISNVSDIHLAGTIYSACRISMVNGGHVHMADNTQWVITPGSPSTYTQPSCIYASVLTVGSNCSIVLENGSTVGLTGGTYAGAYYIDKNDGGIKQA